MVMMMMMIIIIIIIILYTCYWAQPNVARQVAASGIYALGPFSYIFFCNFYFHPHVFPTVITFVPVDRVTFSALISMQQRTK